MSKEELPPGWEIDEQGNRVIQAVHLTADAPIDWQYNEATGQVSIRLPMVGAALIQGRPTLGRIVLELSPRAAVHIRGVLNHLEASSAAPPSIHAKEANFQ